MERFEPIVEALNASGGVVFLFEAIPLELTLRPALLTSYAHASDRADPSLLSAPSPERAATSAHVDASLLLAVGSTLRASVGHDTSSDPAHAGNARQNTPEL